MAEKTYIPDDGGAVDKFCLAAANLLKHIGPALAEDQRAAFNRHAAAGGRVAVRVCMPEGMIDVALVGDDGESEPLVMLYGTAVTGQAN